MRGAYKGIDLDVTEYGFRHVPPRKYTATLPAYGSFRARAIEAHTLGAICTMIDSYLLKRTRWEAMQP